MYLKFPSPNLVFSLFLVVGFIFIYISWKSERVGFAKSCNLITLFRQQTRHKDFLIKFTKTERNFRFSDLKQLLRATGRC